jgi:hypothetical protein
MDNEFEYFWYCIVPYIETTKEGKNNWKKEAGFTLEVKLGGTSWHLIYITPLPKILNFPKFID